MIKSLHQVLPFKCLTGTGSRSDIQNFSRKSWLRKSFGYLSLNRPIASSQASKPAHQRVSLAGQWAGHPASQPASKPASLLFSSFFCDLTVYFFYLVLRLTEKRRKEKEREEKRRNKIAKTGGKWRLFLRLTEKRRKETKREEKRRKNIRQRDIFFYD